MSQKKVTFLLAFSLLAYSQTVISQIRPDSSYQIAELEKKSFERLFQNKRVGNAQGLTRTVASTNFDVNYYRCEWEIDPNLRFIKGKITSYFAITAATDNVVYDLSDTLQVDSITYRGAKVNFQRIANDGLQIKFPSIMPNGQRDSISIYYQGTPRSAASYGAFVQFSHDGVPVIWTLSEPYGAKEWWPSKNGLDDKADSVDIIILSPAAYSGAGNGILRSEDISGGTKTVHYHHSYPIASYLIGIAVTNYTRDVDSIQLGNKFIPIVLNAYPERLSDFKFAGYIAKQVFPKFNELFGDYPFLREHYSQTEWSSNGGMEHQTNTFIGTTNKQTIAHELAHQWFGDQVTCGSWQHIWLNEGFANYAQFIYVQNFDTALIKAHLEYYTNLITSEADGSVFVTDTSSSNRIFDNRLTYAKGGYVVHMLRGVLGDQMFFKGVKQYLNDPLLKNKFALTADLERNLEQVSGRDLSSFFKKWIYGEGYANYSATWSQNKNNWVKVQINQTTSDPSSVAFYDMPVQLQFKNSSRDTIIIVDNRQNGEIFWIDPGFTADTMLIDPQYWILARERNVAKLPVTSVLENDIKIYPNPASDHISIQLLNPTIKTLNIHLYSITGQLVYKHQEKLVGHDELLTVPVSGLSGGIYVLKLSDTSLLKTKKIIVR